jgi:hypothetical protein
MISVRMSLVAGALAGSVLSCRSSSETAKPTAMGSDAGSSMPTSGAPSDAQRAHGGGPLATAEPSPETKALLAKIQGYRSWPKFPENAQPAFSKQHFKKWVVAYYNDVVGRALQAKTLPLPDGSIIAKDNLDSADAAEPSFITTMAKRGGHWYFAETTPDGKVVVMDGKPLEGFDIAACKNCHEQAAANDQVYTHEFK